MPRKSKKSIVPHSNELLVLVGVPGSGKSTFANQLVKSNDSYVKISRDDIRMMLKDSYMVSEELEHVVSDVQDADIEAALAKGLNVVLDNTHCKIKYIKELANKYGKICRINLKIVGAELSLKDIKRQNLQRDKAVPEQVIDRMYKGFTSVVKQKTELLNYINEVSTVQLPKAISPQDDSLKKAIIVDIDGTVAHMGDDRGPFEWHKVDGDAPDINVLNIVRTLSTFYKVIFLSGRDGSCRAKTEAWLGVYFGQDYEMLLMRGSNDYRKDNIIKEEIYNTHIKGKYYIEAVFDDRDQVVKMWRDLGIKCLQVEYGNF